MKKLFPVVTSVALAGILVSCGATTPVEPVPTTPKVETPAAEVTPVTPVVTPDTPAVVPEASVVNPSAPAVDTPATDAMVTPSPAIVPPSAVVGTESNPVVQIPTTKISSEVVKYTSPAGDEEMKVTVESVNNVISKVTVTSMATNDISKKKQTGFAAEVAGVAVGKPVAGLKLDTISGASLTTKAFNEYVQSL